VLLQKFSFRDVFCNFSIELLLFVVIIFSPLIYGSVTILPLSIIETLIFSAFLIFVIKSFVSCEISFIKVNIVPILALIFLAVFQITSLPEGFISVVSPATLSLYKDFRVNSVAYLPLSIYPEMTVHLLLQLLSFLAVFLVALNYIDTEEKGKRIIKVIIFSGLLYSLYGIIKKSYLPNTGFSTFTNYDHFSTYVQLIIPLGIAYSLITKSKVKRAVLLFISSVMIIALFYTWSRAGRISFIISIVSFIVLLRIKRPLGKVVVAVFILLFFLAVFIGLMGVAPLANRIQTLDALFKDYSFRVSATLDTLSIFKNFPLFGTGLGTYAEIAQKYKTTIGHYSYGFSHNEPVQLLTEVGIAGFLSMGLFLLMSFINIFVAWLKRRNDYAVFITIACIIGMFSAILHSFLDFVFHVPANFVLFALILALAFRAAHTSKHQDDPGIPRFSFFLPKPTVRLIFIGVFFVFFLLLESLVINRCRAQLIFDDLKEMKILGTSVNLILGYKRAIKRIDSAIILNSLNSSYLNKKGDFLADLASKEGIENELGALRELGTRKEILLKAEKSYSKSVDINPTKADYHLRLGWLYGELGEFIPAKQEFNKAILLDPKNKKIENYVKDYLNKVDDLSR
jgi:O-antigen ligase